MRMVGTGPHRRGWLAGRRVNAGMGTGRTRSLVGGNPPTVHGPDDGVAWTDGQDRNGSVYADTPLSRPAVNVTQDVLI